MRDKFTGLCHAGVMSVAAASSSYAALGLLATPWRLGLRASGRVVVGVCGSFWEVGEQQALERRLRDSEAKMRLITDALPALIAYVSRPE